MTIADRFAAWWSAWQFVVYLAAALALSVYANYWQWKRAITAPLRAEIAAQARALDDSAVLLSSSSKAATELAAAARRAAANLNESSNDYRAAARAAPLPIQCAPGQARQDAVNRALGAQPEK